MLFAAEAGQWAVGGGLGAVALISLIRFLLGDKGANEVLQAQIRGLSDALAKERRDRRDDIASLNQQIAHLTADVSEQRTEKHRLNNELGQAQMLLGVIVKLAEDCTCGALEVVKDLMARAPTPFTPKLGE